MFNGGRILHHLRYGLPPENTHVLILGYQTLPTPSPIGDTVGERTARGSTDRPDR